MGNFDIARYVSGADSVCREERQFALYLHNVLLGIGAGKLENGKKEILEACGLPEDAHIERVFYEATFMRDIFEPVADVRPFNIALMNYIRTRHPFEMSVGQVLELSVFFNARGRNDGKPQAPQVLSDIRLGRVTDDQIKNLKVGNDAKDALWIARTMMKSKPDLAVVYKKGEARLFLKFIECKYTSDESGKDIKQTEAQKLIAGFLCEQVFDNVFLDPAEIRCGARPLPFGLEQREGQGQKGRGQYRHHYAYRTE